MKKVKIKRGRTASKKQAVELGDVAPVVLENFETLTNPPFKPRLELIEGDPHNPPDMNTNTDQNITTDGEDQNRPDAGDIVSKSPEYKNGPEVSKEEIPHENEHVKQGKKVAETEEEEEDKETETSEESTTEERLAGLKREYASRYNLASRLFDIRLAAGVEEEINRNNFIVSRADNLDTNTLESQVQDSEVFLRRIQASQSKDPTNDSTVTKVSGVTLPSGFNGGQVTKTQAFEDDLEAIIIAG